MPVLLHCVPPYGADLQCENWAIDCVQVRQFWSCMKADFSSFFTSCLEHAHHQTLSTTPNMWMPTNVKGYSYILWNLNHNWDSNFKLQMTMTNKRSTLRWFSNSCDYCSPQVEGGAELWLGASWPTQSEAPQFRGGWWRWPRPHSLRRCPISRNNATHLCGLAIAAHGFSMQMMWVKNTCSFSS